MRPSEIRSGRGSRTTTAKLLVVFGPPCAGKSTLACAIATKFEFRWLQADRLLSALVPGSDRKKTDRDIAYRAALLIAVELLNCSHSVLLDATYGSTEHRKAVEASACALRAPLYLIQCRVSPQLAVDRFKSRDSHPASDLTESRVRDLATRYRYGESGLILRSELPLSDALQRAEEYLCRSEPPVLDASWSTAAVGYSSS
jgi:predicted kinase